MHDTVIRGATIVDGSGAAAFQGDIAIDGDLITEVGPVPGQGKIELDAGGLLVTPGFVDNHTHYDGQVMWDPLLTPSCWQGVTSVIMGNCGVGFAPAPPERRDGLVDLMEGVEDIPASALAAGMKWEWETFPEYLSALDRHPKALDVGCHIAHGPVRSFVMGERAQDPASEDDIRQMAAVVAEAMESGALGFSTSRTILHKSRSGDVVPGTYASEAELFTIGRELQRAGKGVFEVVPAAVNGEGDNSAEVHASELDWMARLSVDTGRPVVCFMLQNDTHPDGWQVALRRMAEASAQGAQLLPMVTTRPVGILFSLQVPGQNFNPQTYMNPLRFRPSYQRLLDLPLNALVERLRDPLVKQAILAEAPEFPDQELAAGMGALTSRLDDIFELTDAVDYEPTADSSIAARARAEGRDPEEYLYDALLKDGGKSIFYLPLLNYSYGNHDALHGQLTDPLSIVGGGDGGAHVTSTCDASNTTYLLSYWVRDRERGPRLGLEFAVNKLTRQIAETWGLTDRGLLAPGMKADVNLIDFEKLQIRKPYYENDLPGGGSRLLQRADGYVATIKSGIAIMQDGVETGARPGAVLRG